ncbi:11414_t:CDS:10 [Ambispora gerdemannii]|uniref:polynucleotide adenylyltransferase n=1 Tax=Ambispora gerdemannii TaxID=144530 RepID=A0A9N9F6U9_9GLOM|nr:11414_t:CDS:10 [Ambispora gerdemannii]
MSTTKQQQQHTYHPPPTYGFFPPQPPPSYTQEFKPGGYSPGFSESQGHQQASSMMPMPTPVFSAYTPPPAPPPPQSVPTTVGGNDSKYFPRPKYQDLWAAILFLLHFAAYIVISVIALANFGKLQRSPDRKPVQRVTLDWSVIWLLLFSAGVGFFFSLVYLFMAEKFPRQFITATFIISIGFYWGITAYYFVVGYFAFGGLVLQFLYQVWWQDIYDYSRIPILVPTSMQTKYTAPTMRHEQIKRRYRLSLILILLDITGTPQGMPRSPTFESLKRATTTSFGSVCLGSLLVALLQTIRALLRTAAQEADNPLAQFCAVCAMFIIECFDELLQFFNFYAYTQVAIFGKSYLHAARDTWTLIRERGLELVANDILVGNVLVMGSILIGMITALLGYLFTIIIQPDFNRGGTFTPLIVFLAFIMGFQMMNVLSSVIHSGVATTFVALAEDPGALHRTKPSLFERKKRKRNSFEASHNTPWTDNYDPHDFCNAIDILNQEVTDFVTYISPLPEEREMRQSVILRINQLLRNEFDLGSVARAYGSYNTDLYLPSSDIDLVLFCEIKNRKRLVYQIGEVIRSLAIESSILKLPFARVPIVKFVEKSSGYHVDISFNQASSLNSANVTKTLIQRYPGSRELLLAVKYFLASLSLNDPSQGGMGSYTALLLVISLLQKHPLVKNPNFVVKDNLGMMLIEFFKLYGVEFNYKKYSINVSKEGSYELKPAKNKDSSKFLVIPDPSDPDNVNVATATSKWINIRQAFASAYETLQETVNHMDHVLYENNDSPEVVQYDAKKGITLLGTIISIDQKYQDARTNAVQAYLFKYGFARKFGERDEWFRRASSPPSGKRKQPKYSRIVNTIDNRDGVSSWYDKSILMDYKAKKHGIELRNNKLSPSRIKDKSSDEVNFHSTNFRRRKIKSVKNKRRNM